MFNMAIRTTATSSVPRKANECFIGKEISLPRGLFGRYWLMGETSLLFGPPGIGKSVLAVQVGDALARGRPIEGFKGPTRRFKVLYADLSQSDVHFQTRYSRFTDDGFYLRSFRFAERFYRGRPTADEGLFEWLRERVAADDFEAVIVDDLTAFRRTQDGAHEAAKLMGKICGLREEFGISVLVLAVSEPPPRDRVISEVQLRRSRVLCGLADSVFALGPCPQNIDLTQLIHIRKGSGSAGPDDDEVPVGRIRQDSGGMVGFQFDNKYLPPMDEETLELVRRVHECRKRGTTFRRIAADLGISKSRAARLAAKWSEDLEGW